jgi:hypothetical protein
MVKPFDQIGRKISGARFWAVLDRGAVSLTNSTVLELTPDEINAGRPGDNPTLRIPTHYWQDQGIER